MKFSSLPVRTNRNNVSYDSKNATLLIKAGFIDQVMAGVYTFLPLGVRVLAKIEQIVREEMDKIGSELLMPAIVPKDLWIKTGRFDSVSVLLKAVGANKLSQTVNKADYVLSSTHEEVVTPLMQKFNTSYKDFPFAVYQIQTKFRNEPRAKSGLLRCREFRMKDLYSFHTSEEDLKTFYEKVKESYTTIFKRLGLGNDTFIVLASGGDFTKDFSHEFQTRCETGEDTIFRIPSTGVCYNKEVAPSMACPAHYKQEAPEPRQEIHGPGIIGVSDIAKFLNLPVEQMTKTLIYETDDKQIVAAAVRGGYDINEEKLKKVLGAKSVQLASPEVVKKATGASIGYIGILNLPKSIRVVMDESVYGRVNFETGANRDNYHTINVNFDRDIVKPDTFYDIKTAKQGDCNPETKETYEVFQGSEVGNIFPLNTKFTKAFGYTFIDSDGTQKPIFMGSYGIGTSRLMGVIAEKSSDENGLVWNDAVAPFTVHLVSLKGSENHGQEVYDTLQNESIEVLWDDRDVSAGVKFSDADLIGIPYRLVVSLKTGDKIEVKSRSEKEPMLIDLHAFIKRIREAYVSS